MLSISYQYGLVYGMYVQYTTKTSIEKPSLKQARKLQATLVRNSAQRLSDSLTGVKCRATSVAKKLANLHKCDKWDKTLVSSNETEGFN